LGCFLSLLIHAVDAKFCIFNLASDSQAELRGFDPRLPLHHFNYIAAFPAGGPLLSRRVQSKLTAYLHQSHRHAYTARDECASGSLILLCASGFSPASSRFWLDESELSSSVLLFTSRSDRQGIDQKPLQDRRCKMQFVDDEPRTTPSQKHGERSEPLGGARAAQLADPAAELRAGPQEAGRCLAAATRRQKASGRSRPFGQYVRKNFSLIALSLTRRASPCSRVKCPFLTSSATIPSCGVKPSVMAHSWYLRIAKLQSDRHVASASGDPRHRVHVGWYRR